MSRRTLGRDGFREGVFARDRRCCVVCGAPAQDAHHILERRLFPDGGYELDNGVSVCSPHHLEAEATTLSCESLRAAAKIERVVLPPHLYADRRYDKWGNPARDDGWRLRGELFFEEPVQKVLAPVLGRFVARSEEPRVLALPWSPGAVASGLVLADMRALAGGEVVVVAEPAGEVIAVDVEGLYVGTGEPIAVRALAGLPALLAELLPPGGRLSGVRSGETMVVTAAWDGRDVCLPWDEVVVLAELAGLPVAATLARGPGDPGRLEADARAFGPHRVRPVGAFPLAAWRRCVARWG